MGLNNPVIHPQLLSALKLEPCADRAAVNLWSPPIICRRAVDAIPDRKKFREMNGAHLASPIRGELGYAHRPQMGSQIHCPIGRAFCTKIGAGTK